jgi:hypothetical protein
MKNDPPLKNVYRKKRGNGKSCDQCAHLIIKELCQAQLCAKIGKWVVLHTPACEEFTQKEIPTFHQHFISMPPIKSLTKGDN